MFATRIHAVALSMEASKSFARRRLRQSQAKVRSTTHRRGSTSKPFAVLERGMISIVHLPSLVRAALSFPPLYAPATGEVRLSHGELAFLAALKRYRHASQARRTPKTALNGRIVA